jgi:DnaJ-like protein
MTERKPLGTSFETWIDKQIREANERGDFDNLPGRGKPLPDANQPYDGDWWLKDWLRREGAPTDALLPTPLRLRKEIQQLRDKVRPLHTEEKVRAAVTDLNDQVRAWWRSSIGPQIHVGLVDVDEVVDRWRSDRAAMAPEPAPAVEPRKRRWWRR